MAEISELTIDRNFLIPKPSSILANDGGPANLPAQCGDDRSRVFASHLD
jgi:hypothetical protein